MNTDNKKKPQRPDNAKVFQGLEEPNTEKKNETDVLNMKRDAEGPPLPKQFHNDA